MFGGVQTVTVLTQAKSVAGGSAADEQPPVFAVYSSKGHAELDAGCSVAVHPPLQMLTLPCGRRVVLCANVEQA